MTAAAECPEPEELPGRSGGARGASLAADSAANNAWARASVDAAEELLFVVAPSTTCWIVSCPRQWHNEQDES
jgi:hypothetical protein